jgi:hypothetical protein
MKQEDKNDLMGMTVNERLFACGLLGEFDRAVREKDREKLKTILKKAYVDEASIDLTVSKLVPD